MSSIESEGTAAGWHCSFCFVPSLYHWTRFNWDGGRRLRAMYLLTLVSPMSIPSFSSFPWIFGAPQSGFSRLIVRMSCRTSLGTPRLPGWPRRIFHVQNNRSLCNATKNRRGLHEKRPGSPVTPRGDELNPQEPICWRQFRAPHGSLQDADLMAQRENLQMRRSTAPKPGGC